MFSFEGQSPYKEVVSDLLETTLDIGSEEYLMNYQLSASGRFRGKRYFAVQSQYADLTLKNKIDYPEVWETEYRLRYQLGQLKLDSRLRYASYLYGINSTNYSSSDFRGTVANNRRNSLSYKLEYVPDVGSLIRIDQAFQFEKQVLEFGKISSFVSLFGDVPWLSFKASNTINPQLDDWGNVLLEARLQEGAFGAILSHRHDLELEPLRADPTILLNQTQSSLQLRYQIDPRFSTSVKTSYNYQPLKPVGNNQPRYWEPLDFSIRYYENLNAATFTYSHNLNEQESRFYNFNTQFRVEDVRISIDQSFWPNSSLKYSNNWRFIWDDVVGIEFANYPFLSLVEYFDDDVHDRTEWIRIFDDFDYLNFLLEYRRSFDSRLERNNIVGNYKNSALSLNLSSNRLYTDDKAQWLRIRSGLTYLLEDALLEDGYLSRFSLGLSAAQTDLFALSANLSYQGITDGEKVDQHLYKLEQLTATTKIFDDIYLSASFNKPWTYSSNAVNPITWSPYPTFYMIYEPNGLDFYAFVESETNTIGIGLGFSDFLGFQLQNGRSLVLP